MNKTPGIWPSKKEWKFYGIFIALVGLTGLRHGIVGFMVNAAYGTLGLFMGRILFRDRR